MKKRTRRLLFCAAIVIFVILSYLTIMLALGYKYNFAENKFVKTGSFQISTNTNADVYINDKLSGNTSLFFNSFSKSRLLPRIYEVKLQKNNYQTWRKFVAIEPGKFADFSKIILLPEPDKFQEFIVASVSLDGKLKTEFIPEEKQLIIRGSRGQLEIINLRDGTKIINKSLRPVKSTGNLDAQLSPDEEKIFTFTKHEIWVKWVKDTRYQPYKKIGEEDLITRFSQEINDIQWYSDSAHLLVSAGKTLKFVEIDVRGGINIMDIKTLDHNFWYDKDNDSVYTLVDKNVVKIYLK